MSCFCLDNHTVCQWVSLIVMTGEVRCWLAMQQWARAQKVCSTFFQSKEKQRVERSFGIVGQRLTNKTKLIWLTHPHCPCSCRLFYLHKEATLWHMCRTLCPSKELVTFFGFFSRILQVATLLLSEGIWRKGIRQKKVKRIDKTSKDTMTAEGMARRGSG